MRLTLPWPLRRFLLGALLCSVTMATAASGAEFVVDAAQATDPSGNVYRTLQELSSSGALSSGDTVILCNDDSSLTSALNVAVHFRSNDPALFRTISGSSSSLYRFNRMPIRPGSQTSPDISGVLDENGAAILKMDSIILNGMSIMTLDPFSPCVKITGNVQFENSLAHAISSSRVDLDGAVSMALEGRFVFLNNNHALHVVDRTNLVIGDNALFRGNYGNRVHEGGAIMSYGGHVIIGDHAVFDRNYVSNVEGSLGGVFYDCVFAGAITVGADAVFTGNFTFSTDGNALGGAMAVRKDGLQYAAETGAITIGPNPSFINNFAYSGRADAYGGVIYSDGDISFSDGVTFINNYAKTSGGAITMGGKCDLLALTKDVLFSGNMVGGVVIGQSDDGFPVVENGIANAIDMNGSLFPSLYTPNLTLAAEEGREIRFNDPITSRNEDPGRPMTLTLNRYTDGEGDVHDTEGTIVFSGELYQGEDTHLAASRNNNFCADTTLYGGVLLLEHDVVFGRNPEEIMDKRYNSSLTVEKGVLEITGGSTANASSFTLSGPGAVLRPGESAFINTHNADLSHGFTFDMRYQLQAGPAFGPGLMLSALETFTAGGYIGVADTEANAPWFYADRSWKQDRVFHVLTDVQHIHEGDFDGAVSQATGTARVDDPYAYTGTWSHRWTDADGDGYAEQLQLVWKADGTPISRVDPELAGELAVQRGGPGRQCPLPSERAAPDRQACPQPVGHGAGRLRPAAQPGRRGRLRLQRRRLLRGGGQRHGRGGRGHLGDRLRAALRPCQKPGFPGAQHAGHPDGLPVLGTPDGRKQQGVLDLQGKPHVGGNAQQHDQPPGRGAGLHGQMEQRDVAGAGGSVPDGGLCGRVEADAVREDGIHAWPAGCLPGTGRVWP